MSQGVQIYMERGKPIKDIWAYCKKHKFRMIRATFKQYQPLTGTWHKWTADIPEPWFNNLRMTEILVNHRILKSRT